MDFSILGVMSLENWLAFLSIAFLATVTPGPAILLVMTHSLSKGFKRSLMAIAGNVSGLFIMSLCSVLGLSALVLSSTSAFLAIKFIGALYLMYMGWKMWRHGIQFDFDASESPNQYRKSNLYFQGIMVALTNPKAIVFTTALFPQFITPSEPLAAQFSLLVGTLIVCSALCLTAYGYWGTKLLRRSTKTVPVRRLSRIFGTTFIGAGVTLAATANR
ncbi:Putative threonine/lysine efflux protein [Vibrio nigripulchritudo SFn27]|uniref:Threonine/lysine efflux protein n=2 Tax=Vibrio nigripulchritudo TaxID=28173 RepID=A0AAV2VR29_9VIBR|nr:MULTISPECIES: LysE family translocator [Vibrio]CCN72717.1 Putative threonine/lysine efflux protein [Vibrio nigripulchritudo SFn118]CCN81393.1 Putative threonine/lysine efflux protein [Vibrio nigripulchritudo BLFn1]CCN91248.1 Putative threonine/lysine efflux protein [Vibrio nigripulchritudo SFn27]CCN96347.1 Putative threonine/lysine efflux protein [Vibrio nigripulchritudo ENn2]CCO38563.1 Putative threonine/lysine efflux protein [Vibrio nigripulchritudo SFn135]